VKLFGTHSNADGQKFVSTGQQSLIVSMLSVGTFFGALSGATIADLFGRRLGLLGMHDPTLICSGKTRTDRV
jgi:SP family sugar:H+ symporter-like MFS transporter